MTDAPTRRMILAGAGAAAGMAATGRLSAQGMGQGTGEVVPLWPAAPPGGRTGPIAFQEESRPGPVQPNRAWSGIDRPRLIVRRAARPNGTAALVMPGGGYVRMSWDNEGEEQARWLNALGVTVFLLAYRLPGEGWQDRANVPLMDAQRAVRLIRADAARYGVRPDRVIAMGFSAGGHLCGSLATRHAARVYAPVDAADRQSARPDLAAPIYPVVTLTRPLAHGGSRDALLGADAPDALAARYSVENNVDGDTPPVFLAHAGDDRTVPVGNSVLLYQALRAKDRPAELHLFEEGGHGFGTRLPPEMPAAQWPRLLTAFARRKGVLPPA